MAVEHSVVVCKDYTSDYRVQAVDMVFAVHNLLGMALGMGLEVRKDRSVEKKGHTELADNLVACILVVDSTFVETVLDTAGSTAESDLAKIRLDNWFHKPVAIHSTVVHHSS